MSFGPDRPVPFQIDLSSIAPRSVASLYSHLVTRPTGRALRLGIESQLGELGASCISVLDFTQVVVLDYSCADEAVAKLIQRYAGADRPAEVYFVARGLGEQHRDPLEAVLARHGLLLAGEVGDLGFQLLGDATLDEQRVWAELELVRSARSEQVAATLGLTDSHADLVLATLADRRVVMRQARGWFLALSSVLEKPQN